ncbi:MAG TPA: response regulator [Candidatus Nitrosocosmicus sp.]|nr:response regulator [Candidatus Nitrosocosmicus sp.]
MSIEYLKELISYSKDIKNHRNSSDKHISLPTRASTRKHLTDNGNHKKIPPHPNVGNNNKYRVLLAESNSGVRAVIKLYLETMNLDYNAADNGNKALRLFSNTIKKRGKNYDVVLLDSHLEGLSGLEVAIHIHKYCPHQRIMIMSTLPREHLSNELLNLAKIHESDIFTRPFRLSDLICSIEPMY